MMMAIKALEQEFESTYKYGVPHKMAEFFRNWDGDEDAKREISVNDMREIADVYIKKARIERQLKEKALEQQPYEKFESTKDHIYKLAGDYKCWDNRLTEDEAVELCHILEQQPCEDPISRKDALKALDYDIKSFEFKSGVDRHMNEIANLLNTIYEIQSDNIKALPPVQPKYNTSEWCHDCSEYNQDKHCCPRYNKVIRSAVEEMKQSKTGHWIYDKRLENWKCSECGRTPKTIGYVGRAEFMREHFKFCNHCGAKMIGVKENEG
jgi:hypothetical protein